MGQTTGDLSCNGTREPAGEKSSLTSRDPESIGLAFQKARLLVSWLERVMQLLCK